MVERTGAYRVLVKKCDRKRPNVRWEDDIKMDLQEKDGRGMDWMDLATGYGYAHVNTITKLWVP